MHNVGVIITKAAQIVQLDARGVKRRRSTRPMRKVSKLLHDPGEKKKEINLTFPRVQISPAAPRPHDRCMRCIIKA